MTLVQRPLVRGPAAGETGNGPRRGRGADTGVMWLWVRHALRRTSGRATPPWYKNKLAPRFLGWTNSHVSGPRFLSAMLAERGQPRLERYLATVNQAIVAPAAG